MKNLFLLSLFLFCSSCAFAGSNTTNMGLYKPDDGESGWGDFIRDNYDIIDSSAAILSSTQTFTASQTFVSSVTFSTFTAVQVRIGTQSYTGASALPVRGQISTFGPSGGSVVVCANDQGTACGQIDKSTDRLTISGGTTGGGGFAPVHLGTFLTTDSAIVPAPTTLAFMQGLANDTTWQIFVCSDCVRDTICISTSTAPGSYVSISSRTLACQ